MIIHVPLYTYTTFVYIAVVSLFVFRNASFHGCLNVLKQLGRFLQESYPLRILITPGWREKKETCSISTTKWTQLGLKIATLGVGYIETITQHDCTFVLTGYNCMLQNVNFLIWLEACLHYCILFFVGAYSLNYQMYHGYILVYSAIRKASLGTLR